MEILRIKVERPDGSPAAGSVLRIRAGGELVAEPALDAGGRAAVILPAGEVTLEAAEGCLIYAGETLAPPGPDRTWTMGPGESLFSVAAAAELPSWRCLWHYAPNAALRARRSSPHQLVPGDVLRLPETAEVRLPDRLRAAGVAVLILHPEDRPWLNLDLVDSAGLPVQEALYRIEWADGSRRVGTTDATGRVHVPIPRGVARGTLDVVFRRFVLDVGGMPPIEETTGVQLRLNQLNYFCGPPDGTLGAHSQAALRAFQREHGLEQTGLPDANTRAALVRVYGA